MKHRFACLVSAALCLSAGPRVDLSAQPRHHDAGMDIVVNGVPQKHYLHRGRWYVEALKGKEYAIRLRNPYPVRVAVALSVDGLNTIDARHTTAADARKWVIDPYQTITISGWQVNSAEARRFEFTTEARSYGQALGMTDNLGTISAVFFKERAAAVAREFNSGADAGPRGSRNEPAPLAAPSAAPQVSADASTAQKRQAAEEGAGLAATGMGDRTTHTVTQIWMDLEATPAHSVNVRYEYRPELIRMGILLATPTWDPLARRDGARGFEPGFSPEVPRR